MQLPLFADSKSGLQGVRLERTFRVLCALLDGWCRYNGQRGQSGPFGDGPLGAIEFDKFVNVIARIWGQLSGRRLDGTKSGETQEGKVIVGFPFPLLELPGKHGRGRAIYDHHSPPDFIGTVLFKLQELGILHYFNIVTHDSGDPGHPSTLIETAIPIPNLKAFLDTFTEREIEVVQDLRQAMRVLTPEEIRALGTHENRRKTIEDIEREFRYLVDGGTLAKLIAALRSGQPFVLEANELVDFTDEAWRKAAGNREAYENGRARLLSLLLDADVKAAVEVCQGRSEEIWREEDQELLALVQRASRAKTFGKYVKLVAVYSSDQRLRSNPTAEEGRKFSEAAVAARRHSIGSLPRTIAGLFISTSGHLRPEIVERLISEIRGI